MILVWLVGCRAVEGTVLRDIPDRFVEMQLGAPAEPARIEGRASDVRHSSKLRSEFRERRPADGTTILILGDRKEGVKDGVVGGQLGAFGDGDDEGGAQREVLRSWFPEAFLWRPSLQTDAQGRGSLDVLVPDQLTTWRVLALAHDQAGHQAGSTHTFDSTLPAYLDPVVPGWGFVGDRYVLPVQVVNNRSEALGGRVEVQTSGALQGRVGETVQLGPFGSSTLNVPVETVAAGEAVLSAALPGVDRVRRSWSVVPTGRPVVQQRSGTLNGSRALSLSWPDGADLRTASYTVEVQPGPLAVVLAEVQRLDAGGRWSQAYAYQVLASAERLLEATGATTDPETLRRVRKRAWQRLVRRGRAPSVDGAVQLLFGLGPQPSESLEAMLRHRLLRVVVEGQRADGTWSRQDRDALQAVLVQTASAARTLPEDETGARLRAAGALERYQPNIDEAFTASIVLASGLLPPSEPLLETLHAGLVPLDPTDPDGAKTVYAPDVQSPFGGRATDVEARAWMALALLELGSDEGRTQAGDLASQILGSYGASTGFGAGAADGVLLEALEAALPTVDVPVQLTLAADGDDVAHASVDPEQPGVSAMMASSPRSATTEIELHGAPGAGLTWTLTQRSWVPWTGEEGLPGVDVEVEANALVAGASSRLSLRMAAPSGASLTVVQGLPAGTVVEYPEILRERPDIEVFDVQADHVRIETTPFGAGEIREVFLSVVPRYSGTLHTAPLQISSGGQTASVEPVVWSVR